VPTQPLSFIRRFEELFALGLGFVALAELDGATAAAAVFLGAGPTLTYKYGASDRAALHARPNNLLFAEAIERARERGHRHLDLGRTDFDNDGLRRFKTSWGAREERLAYTYVGREPPEPGHSRAERMLAAVITRAPPVAGRAIGAALYRHAG
jgi:lipid II:glycine glycyltransferase (peptidoglycan interpeptide bridge formation enzyme)